MHADFHILCFFSANMAFSLAFAQTTRTFLSFSFAFGFLFKSLFCHFPSFFCHFQSCPFPLIGKLESALKLRHLLQSQRCSFIPTRTGWVINLNKEMTLRTNLIMATTQEPHPKIVQTQTCSQNTSLLIAHVST